MKKMLFVFLAIIFGACTGTLGYFSLQTNEAGASSVNVSVWDGKYYEAGECTSEDLYKEDEQTYFIRSAKGLSYLVRSVNKTGPSMDFKYATFYLETDIDLGNHPWIPLGGLTESGTYRAFRGTFEGKGHYIYNLNISQSADGLLNYSGSEYDFAVKRDGSTVGFFGALREGSKIQNLHFKNVNIDIDNAQSDMHIGGMVGYVFDNVDSTSDTTSISSIKNCSVEGNINVSNVNNPTNISVGGVTGGLLGATIGNLATEGNAIMGVKSMVDISISGENTTVSSLKIGGIAGSSSNTAIYNSANEGSIVVASTAFGYVGGLIGYSKGKSFDQGDIIENAYNVGTIRNASEDLTGDNVGNVGGLIGYVDSVDGSASVFNINHTYTANVMAGLIGTIASQNISSSIKNSYVIADESNLTVEEPITSRQDEIVVLAQNVYLDSTKSKLNANKVGQYGDLENLAHSKEFYLNKSNWADDAIWDFDTSWKISTSVNNGFPYFYIGAKTNDMAYSSDDFLNGEGTAENPYLIETPADLVKLSYVFFEAEDTENKANKYYSLQNDIDLTGLIWVPIGLSSPFNGVFDGNNHTISGMTCSLQQQFEYHALFAKTSDAVIKNLIIEGVRYINEGMVDPYATTPATLIGSVEGQTYVINCKDETTDDTIYTIGKTSKKDSVSNLTVLYGTNNEHTQSGIKINHSCGGSLTGCDCFNYGFDIEISGEGGIFYNASTEMTEISGEIVETTTRTAYPVYHVLVDSNYQYIKQEIDSTYSKALFPYVDLKNGDMIIKAGSKLVGFNRIGNDYAGSPETLDYSAKECLLGDGTVKESIFNEDGSIKLSALNEYDVAGLKAVWKNVTVKINVDYNNYETQNFSAVGDVVREYYIDYGAYLSEQTQVFDLFKTGDNALRPDFVIDKYYFDAELTDEIDFNKEDFVINEFTKVRGQNLLTAVDGKDDEYIAITVYATWKGTESADKRIRITMTKTDDQFSKNFDMDDLQLAVKLIATDAAGKTKETVATLDSQTATEYVFVVYFDTLYSDTKQNHLQLKINIKDGYYADPDPLASKEGYVNKDNIVPPPQEFGIITTSENKGTDILTVLNNREYYNLSGDYDIEFQIARRPYQKDFLVGEGVHYGIAPIIEDYQEFMVWNGTSFVKINNGAYNANDARPLIAFDFLSGEVMADTGNYDITTLDSNCFIKDSSTGLPKYAIFTYKLPDNNYTFYIYECVTSNNDNADIEHANKYTINVYHSSLTNFSSKIEDIISDTYFSEKLVSIDGYCDVEAGTFERPHTLRYLSESTFALVYSTEADASTITTYSVFQAEENGSDLNGDRYYVTKLKTTETQTATGGTATAINKMAMYFEDFVDFEALINGNIPGDVSVTAYYTTAYIANLNMYSSNELDENGKLKEENLLTTNAPRLSLFDGKYAYEVNAAGEIIIDIEATDYYKFAFGSGVELYQTSGVSNVDDFNIKVSVDYANIIAGENAGDVELYDGLFEGGNKDYFTADSTLYYKGQSDPDINGKVFAQDTYRIVLGYRPGYTGSVSDLQHGLQAGAYTINIICEEVDYDINIATKFVDEDDEGTANFSDDQGNNAKITTTFENLTDSESTTVNYGDEINFVTTLGENNGYVFYGWYSRQNSAQATAKYFSYNQNLEILYSELNNQDNQNQIVYTEGGLEQVDLSKDRFAIDVYAVYLRKEVDLFFGAGSSIRYMIEDYNGTGEDRISTSPASEINTQLELRNRQNESVTELNYSYSTADESETSALNNVQIVITGGLYSEAYYVHGVAIVDYYNQPIKKADGTDMKYILAEGQTTFDFYADIKAKLEEDSAVGVNTRFYILPILRQKRVTAVFHSGTGDSTNLYGDTKEGQIYDTNGNLIDNATTYEIENMMFNLTINTQTYAITSNGEEMSILNAFKTRTGYQNNRYNYYWIKDGISYASTFKMRIDFFRGVENGGEIHFYRIWEAREYKISFDINKGVWVREISRIGQTYDAAAITPPTTQNVTRTGYNFMGWAINDDGTDKVFNADGTVYDADPENDETNKNTLFDEDGCYINPSDITLYAIWEAKTYNFKIHFNGANSINGTEVVDNQMTYMQTYSIVYDTTFETIIYNSEMITLESILPERAGFNFDGMYLVGTTATKVTNETKFNLSLSTFVDNIENAFTLYVGWSYDTGYLDLIFEDSVVEKTYNSTTQTVYVAEYFSEGNYTTTNIIVDKLYNDISFDISDDMHATLLASLNRGNTLGVNGLSFNVKDAGSYSVGLTFSLKDDAIYLNLDKVWEYTTILSFNMNRALVSIAQTENTYFEDAKRIMQPFYSESALSGAASVYGLASISDDSISSTLTDEEMYQYLMVKYYNVLTTNDATLHETYRNWTYADYQTYTEENDVSTLLSSLKNFDFYDYNRSGLETLGSGEVKDISVVYGTRIYTLDGDYGELTKSAVKVYFDSDIYVYNSYDIRVYVTAGATQTLDNYNLLVDENGDRYLTIGKLYIVPQIFDIDNLGDSMSYYQEFPSQVHINWIGSRESIEYSNNDYYVVDENAGYYLLADIYTSSNGSKEEDTIYSFYDYTNYISINEVQLIRFDGEKYYDLTSNFKFVMSDDYTILNISDVAQINVTAKYLTTDVGYVLSDLTGEEYLRITKVTYSLDGTTFTKEDENGLALGLFSAQNNGGQSVPIYEIKQNNDGTVSLFANSSLLSATVVVPNLKIDTYTSLYKWTSVADKIIDGTMESNNSITFDFAFDRESKTFEIETSKGDVFATSEEGLTNVEYYALFTDLVKVNYDLNFDDVSHSFGLGVLKLGESTYDDIYLPSVSGFDLATLTETNTGVDILVEANRAQVFKNDGIFVGLSDTNYYLPLNLEAKWTIQEIAYTQLMTYRKGSVYSFGDLYATEVIALESVNHQLFTYSYEWQYSKTETGTWGKPNTSSGTDSTKLVSDYLTLKDSGSGDESGFYKLRVVATLSSAYADAVVDATHMTQSCEVVFQLEFVKIKLVSVETLTDLTSTYNNQDQRNVIVKVSYQTYDRLLDDYAEATVSEQSYTTTGIITYEIKKDGNVVTSVVNAGDYNYKIKVDEDVFDTSAMTIDEREFVFTINPAEYDISGIDFTFSKQFNTTDSALIKNIYNESLADTISIELSRPSGENVGEYDLFMKDILSTNKLNYIIKYGEKSLMSGGVLTTDGTTTKIGTFTINPADKLILSYDTTVEDEQIVLPYITEGYDVKFVGQKMQIVKYGTEDVVKELTVKYYDYVASSELTNAEILGYVSAQLQTLTVNFYAVENYIPAKNTGVYGYKITNSSEMGAYYLNVDFNDTFKFVIDGQEINVAEFNFTKTYDKTNKQYFRLDKTEIEDIDSYTGVYLDVTYASMHVGNDIHVDLMIKIQGGTEITNNYTLSANVSTGTITKRSANLTVTLKSNSYEYGIIDINSLSSLVDSTQLTDAEGNDLSELLVGGYYSIKYSLPEETKTSKGYIYVGNYTLTVTPNYDDFAVTLTASPTFAVTQKVIDKTINEGYIVISSADILPEFYTETLSIETGEEIELSLQAQDVPVDADNKPTTSGLYDLAFEGGVYSKDFLDGNVKVNLTADNGGLKVAESQEVLYVSLDSDLSSQIYNGKGYTISVSGNVLNINTEDSTVVYTANFVVENSAGETVADAVSNISVINERTGDETISKGVGTNKLIFSATIDSGAYSSISFASYSFVITQKEINVANLSAIEKQYDGDVLYTIETIAEKVTGDDLRISAQFVNSEVGDGKSVLLSLQGADKANYVLNASSTTGEITKAEATIELDSTTFTYGQLSKTNSIGFKLYANGKEIAKINYSIVLLLSATDDDYSNGYLNVGTYTVSLDTANSSSTNYNLNFEEVDITVSAYQLDVVFNEPGGYRASFGDEQNEVATFTTNYLTPLNENVELQLTRRPNANGSLTELGDYYIDSATTTNTNYNIKSTTDNAGYYRIVKGTEIVYLLLSDEEIVSAEGNSGLEFSMEYNGLTYDIAEIEQNASGVQLVIYNSVGTLTKKYFTLNTYTLVGTNYVKSEVSFENLNTSLYFVSNAKQVDEYRIGIMSSTSDNYEVKVGKNGNANFYLEITKKQLYLKADSSLDNISIEIDDINDKIYIATTFNNENAQFSFDDASGLITGLTDEGVISGESVGMDIVIYTDSTKTEVAKYVSTSIYATFEMTLTGDYIENYNFNLEVLDASKNKVEYDIVGNIKAAPITFVINSQSFTYGDEINIEFDFTADVNWDGYDYSRISCNFEVASPQYSTSGNLNANESGYGVVLYTTTLSDFYVSKYVVNGAQQTELTGAKIIVKAKELVPTQKQDGETLKDIFTKVYDGDTNAVVSDTNGLLFDLAGAVKGDDITIGSAQYASEAVSDNVVVNFTLDGEDKINYKIGTINGTISPIIITIQYANRDGVESDVTQAGRTELTQIKYPLVGSSLTANSNLVETSSTYNFPKTLYQTGHTFSHWVMEFEIESQSAYNFLIANTNGMDSAYSGSTYSVEVGNNEKTVKLINALIEDANDYFGLYYKNNSNPVVVFKAVYDVQKVRLTVNILDESGTATERGTIKVSYGTTEKTLTKSNIIEVEYGTQNITVGATANEHYYFVRYDVGGGVQTNSTYTIAQITEAITINAVFGVQKVNVVYDLSGIDISTITIPEIFVTQGNGQYKWAADYALAYNKTLSELMLTKAGYDVSSMNVKVKTAELTIDPANFATAKVGDYLSGVIDDTIDVVLTPTFTPKDIKVVLVYNHDNLTKEIYVPYEKSYGEAKDSAWDDAPIWEGHVFEGWWNGNGVADVWGEQITSDSVITSTADHLLYAKWCLDTYKLELSAKNATITNPSVAFVEDEGKWIIEEIEYGTEILFTLTPNSGYMVSESGWADEFDVTFNADKSALVKITIPAKDTEFEMPTEPERNKVSLTGEKIKIMTYTIDSNPVEVDLEDPFETEFNIETGKIVEIKFETIAGYEIKTIDIDKTDGLTITNIYDDVNTTVLIGVKIEGIYQNIAIEAVAEPRENKINFVVDYINRINEIEDSDGYITTLTENSVVYTKSTGGTLVLYVDYNTGFEFGSVVSNDFTVECTDETTITISDIYGDGTVTLTTKKTKYTIVGQAISYEQDLSKVEVAGNIVYVNGLTSSVEIEIGQSITLSNVASGGYNFAGWSKDGESTFDVNSPATYTLTVEDVERYAEGTTLTFYGIFSKLQYNISFGTYSYYTVGTEYNDDNKLETKYVETIGTYFDETGTRVTSMSVFYGTERTVTFEVPTGYTYYGYGYVSGGTFTLLGQNETSDPVVKVKILSSQLTDQMQIYFLVRPMSTKLIFENKINYDGVYELDYNVGSTALYGANEKYKINQYGYVDGTQVYIENYTNGLSDKNISVVAYSGDEVYIRIRVLREGYKFQTVKVSGTAQASLVEETNAHVIYKISEFVGGIASKINIDVVFRPQIHVINLSYTNRGNLTDGGAFAILKSEENSNKVFSSGKEYSAMMVSAYTDTDFEVIAFIRAGFYVEPENFKSSITDSGNIIVANSLSYQALSVVETGYSGMIKFKVAGYIGQYDISIALKTERYTVNLKEGSTILATIKNVEFDSLLNLSQNNQENIEIVDTDRIMFIANQLYVVISLDNHHFQGYFTSQNGAGVQYINSNGESIKSWNENGYVYNNLTSRYDLAPNAHIDEETGEMIIDLYLYQSYLKTRISFELLPSIDSNITAQDMISGVDYTNSWFYATSPMYIEVSFDTDIYFTAPEFDGYTFYKFIISQKSGDGTWLTDVESLSNNIPWSTNEIANIVECKVTIVYYAKIDVQIIGGEGRYVIMQSGTPAEMLNNSYVDTSKEFTITAIAGEGYEFLHWKRNGEYVFDTSITISTTNQINLQMYLQGFATALNFEAYDTTFGQIHSLRVTSQDGSFKSIRLGAFSGSDFIKMITETSTDIESQKIKVGDVVTFVLSIDYGFGVIWNRNDIVYDEYLEGYYYFTMAISPEFAGQTVEIIPTFDDEVLSIFLTRKFADVNDDAIDLNFVDMAGTLTFNGKKVNSFTAVGDQDIIIGAQTKTRYKISNVVVYNYDKTYQNIPNILTEDSLIVLTTQFLTDNNIVGNVHVEVEYARALWQDIVIVDKFEGTGTNKNEYKIKSVKDLALMMQLVNSGAENEDGLAYKDAHYLLETDLDLAEYFWTPIGTHTNEFNGEFDFGEHKITGVFNAYYFTPTSYNGLFGVLGENANIHTSSRDIWYIYLAVGLGCALMIALIIIILVNKKRKKRRQELANK